MSLQQGGLDLRELGGSVAVITGAGNGGIGEPIHSNSRSAPCAADYMYTAAYM